jgi:hypothetical protein
MYDFRHWHNVYTKLHPDPSSSARVESCERTKRHGQPCVRSCNAHRVKNVHGREIQQLAAGDEILPAQFVAVWAGRTKTCHRKRYWASSVRVSPPARPPLQEGKCLCTCSFVWVWNLISSQGQSADAKIYIYIYIGSKKTDEKRS